MSEVHIDIQSICKNFNVPVKNSESNIYQKLKNVFYRKWNQVEVIKNISFQIHKGEFLGYIGANGAGKSTTIKLMTGILSPDQGKISCLGFDPYRDRYAYTYHIGVVFGQKSILEYEIPVKASFELYREIYEMDYRQYQQRLGFFNEILSLEDYFHIPVRKLSFGQRMRCEVAASLLHGPEIVFLDEPTIGLDASAKKEIREFLRVINEKDQTTVILTTHDMKDIEYLCKRVLMIDQGKIIYDGNLERLKQQCLQECTIRFRLNQINHHDTFTQLKKQCINISKKDDLECWHLSLKKIDISHFTQELLQAATFSSFSILEPELEDIVEHIYQNGILN